MARASRKGRKAGKTAEPKRGVLYGLPEWVKHHASLARRGAKTPIESIQRMGAVVDGVLGRYLETIEEDDAIEGGANWESLARVVAPLAEARRKLAATEAELTPKGGDGANFTHDLTTREDGRPDGGPKMWEGNAAVTIATVTGDEPDED